MLFVLFGDRRALPFLVDCLRFDLSSHLRKPYFCTCDGVAFQNRPDHSISSIGRRQTDQFPYFGLSSRSGATDATDERGCMGTSLWVGKVHVLYGCENHYESLVLGSIALYKVFGESRR